MNEYNLFIACFFVSTEKKQLSYGWNNALIVNDYRWILYILVNIFFHTDIWLILWSTNWSSIILCHIKGRKQKFIQDPPAIKFCSDASTGIWMTRRVGNPFRIFLLAENNGGWQQALINVKSIYSLVRPHPTCTCCQSIIDIQIHSVYA